MAGSLTCKKTIDKNLKFCSIDCTKELFHFKQTSDVLNSIIVSEYAGFLNRVTNRITWKTLESVH